MDGNPPITSADDALASNTNNTSNTSENVRAWPGRPTFPARNENERTFGANFKLEMNRPELPQQAAPPMIPQEPVAERNTQPNNRMDRKPDLTGEPSKVEETAGLPPRVTAAVVRIEDRARRLAACLNHPEVTLDHYVIAMTFENEGSEAFEQKKLELRKSCLANLIGQQPVSEARVSINFSPDVRRLMSAAAQSAQKREGELRLVSVRDLSEALPKELFGSPQAHLTMQGLALRMERVAFAVDQMQRQINEAVPLARGQWEQAARLVEETAQRVRAQNQQTAGLESLVRELVQTERAANDNSRRRWTLWGRVTAVAGLAVFSLGAAAFTYFSR